MTASLKESKKFGWVQIKIAGEVRFGDVFWSGGDIGRNVEMNGRGLTKFKLPAGHQRLIVKTSKGQAAVDVDVPADSTVIQDRQRSKLPHALAGGEKTISTVTSPAGLRRRSRRTLVRW